MSRILMTVWPIETHLSPLVATGRALRARGHEVAFYTGLEATSKLREEGFTCFPFRDVSSHHAHTNPGSAAAQRIGMRARRRLWHDFLLGSVRGQLSDLDRIWAEWPPDTVVCDITMWGPILTVQETKGTPVAVFSHPAYCLLAGRDNPAPGISLPLCRTALGRMAGRALTSIINFGTASIRREASLIRVENGLRPLAATVMDYTGQMPLHLVPSAPEFDYGRDDLPASVRYVGPCLPDTSSENAPGWVTRSRRRRRIVVLEELHAPEDAFLLKTAARAFADGLAEVVIVAGQGCAPATLEAGAANVQAVPWAPLDQAVSSADVVIAHGNSETVLTALSRGIPMVVVPRILEQPAVAWRLAATGAGVRLPMRACTPRSLRRAAEHVLTSSVFAHNARRIGAAFERMGGPARAAELIERLDRNQLSFPAAHSVSRAAPAVGTCAGCRTGATARITDLLNVRGEQARTAARPRS